MVPPAALGDQVVGKTLDTVNSVTFFLVIQIKKG